MMGPSVNPTGRNYAIYDVVTGRITMTIHTDNIAMVEAQTEGNPGLAYVEGDASSDRHMVENGEIVERTIEAAATIADVDAECRRRLSYGFLFEGDRFQARQRDQAGISDAASAAYQAAQEGFGAGDLRWDDPDQDYVRIAADNSRVPMDAPTVVEFGRTARRFVSATVLAARTLKDRILAGERIVVITRDDLWPFPAPTNEEIDT